MKMMNQKGQSMVMALVFLTVMMGMSALVLDVGSWYRAHRAAQSTADASALAAAQAIPDTARATALAEEHMRPGLPLRGQVQVFGYIGTKR